MLRNTMRYAGLCACLCAMRAGAADYCWQNVSGDWDGLSNWSVGAPAAAVTPVEAPPGSEDSIYFQTGSYALRLVADTTIGNLILDHSWTLGIGEKRPLFNLDGKTLTVNGKLCSSGNPWDYRYGTHLTLSNGIVRCANVDASDNPSREHAQGHVYLRGPLDLQSTGSVGLRGKGSTLEVTGGAQATFSGHLRAQGDHPGVLVSGTGTKLTVSGIYGLYAIGSLDFTISDGASAYFASFETGYSDNGPAYGGTTLVDNGTLEIGTEKSGINNSGLTIGYGYNGNEAVHDIQLVVTNGGVVKASAKSVCIGAGNRKVTTGPGAFSNRILIAAGGSLLPVTEETSYTIYVGAGSATSNRLDVVDGTVVCGSVQVGGYSSWGIGDVLDYASNNVFRVAGSHPSVTLMGADNAFGVQYGGALNIYHGGVLRFEIGKDGYADTPIKITRGSVLTNQKTDHWGIHYTELPARLEIEADVFARNHPGTKVTLLSCAVASKSALEELVNNATIEGKAKYRGTLTVESDNTKICYTTPKAPGLMMLLR